MFSERWVGVGKFVGFTQTGQFLWFFRSSIVHNMTTRHRTRLTVKSKRSGIRVDGCASSRFIRQFLQASRRLSSL
jgi:hypothetical protein